MTSVKVIAMLVASAVFLTVCGVGVGVGLRPGAAEGECVAPAPTWRWVPIFGSTIYLRRLRTYHRCVEAMVAKQAADHLRGWVVVSVVVAEVVGLWLLRREVLQALREAWTSLLLPRVTVLSELLVTPRRPARCSDKSCSPSSNLYLHFARRMKGWEECPRALGVPWVTHKQLTEALAHPTALLLHTSGQHHVWLSRVDGISLVYRVAQHPAPKGYFSAMLKRLKAIEQFRGEPGMLQVHGGCTAPPAIITHYGGAVLSEQLAQRSLSDRQALLVLRDLVTTSLGLWTKRRILVHLSPEHIYVLKTADGGVKVTISGALGHVRCLRTLNHVTALIFSSMLHPPVLEPQPSRQLEDVFIGILEVVRKLLDDPASIYAEDRSAQPFLQTLDHSSEPFLTTSATSHTARTPLWPLNFSDTMDAPDTTEASLQTPESSFCSLESFSGASLSLEGSPGARDPSAPAILPVTVQVEHKIFVDVRQNGRSIATYHFHHRPREE